MANDGKIYITISDTRGGSGVGVSNDSDSGASGGSGGSDNALLNFAQHEFYHMIRQNTETLVMYSINNIGNFTGNYQQQRDINLAISNVKKIISLGNAAATGARIGSSVGGGIGAGVGAAIAVTASIITDVINAALRYDQDLLQTKITNRNISIMRERLGLEGLTNGSRTGGY